jgi:ferredoxin
LLWVATLYNVETGGVLRSAAVALAPVAPPRELLVSLGRFLRAGGPAEGLIVNREAPAGAAPAGPAEPEANRAGVRWTQEPLIRNDVPPNGRHAAIPADIGHQVLANGRFSATRGDRAFDRPLPGHYSDVPRGGSDRPSEDRVPKITFLNEAIEVEVAAGQTIRDVADQAGITLVRGLFPRLHCRGRGLCGRCRVWATPRQDGALSPHTFWERIRRYQGTRRLACQARVLGDVEVRTMPDATPPHDDTVWPADPNARWRKRVAADEERAKQAAAAPKPEKAAAPKADKPPTATAPPSAAAAAPASSERSPAA